MLGGGYNINGSQALNPDIEFLRAYPDSNTTYTVTAVEDSPVSSSWSITAWALCGLPGA